MNRLIIIEAPSALGLSKRGVERLPRVLLDCGLADGIGALRGPALKPPLHGTVVDPRSGVLNADAIAAFSIRLADAVGTVLDGGGFPVVLGGDCSIVLGNLLALRRRGRPGLFFVDGHADFYLPEVLPDGEAASMDLAFATGRGPDVVSNLESRRPLVHDADVVVYGRRDAAEAEQYHSPRVEETAALLIDLDNVRREGAAAAAERGVRHLDSRPIDGYWIHVDVDVLEDHLMPSVDYRMPGGLRWDEFVDGLRVAVHGNRARGLHIGIYNPDLDPRRVVAKALVDALTHVFSDSDLRPHGGVAGQVRSSSGRALLSHSAGHLAFNVRRTPMSHENYAQCIEACNACAIACNHCAAACLTENDVKMMAKCIALDLDCAAICQLAAAAMARGSEHTAAICALCAEICEACADECEQHEAKHCKDCAQACNRCAVACRAMAQQFPTDDHPG